jgi:hypothetical protein
MDTHSTAPVVQSRVATIQAKPQAVVVHLATSAVNVIDMQNDFGTEGRHVSSRGIDISMIQQAVGPTGNVLLAARRNGLPIIYLKMAFKADLSDAGSVDSPNYARHQLLGVGTVIRLPTTAKVVFLFGTRGTPTSFQSLRLGPMTGCARRPPLMSNVRRLS